MNIALENRQRAKVLSSPVQIQACETVIMKKKQILYQKQMAVYKKETKMYEMNECCEMKLIELMNAANRSTIDNNTMSSSSNGGHNFHSFLSAKTNIDINLFSLKGTSKIINKELAAFIKVRSVCHLQGNTLTFKDIPNRRDKLLGRLVQLRDTDVRPRMFPVPPIKPEGITNCHNVSEVMEENGRDEVDLSNEADNGDDIIAD